MLNYAVQQEQARIRREEAMNYAEQHRLAQLAQPEHTPLTGQILAGIGDVLVGVGTRLQEQRLKPVRLQTTNAES